MTEQPQIARVALAVELTDGTKIRLYSAEVSGSVEIETKREPTPVFPGRYDPRHFGPPQTTITIHDVRGYLIQYGDGATKAIDQAKQELEETPK